MTQPTSLSGSTCVSMSLVIDHKYKNDDIIFSIFGMTHPQEDVVEYAVPTLKSGLYLVRWLDRESGGCA